MNKIEEGIWGMILKVVFQSFFFLLYSFFFYSCTEDFEPRADFVNLASPYGILMVDADTQWVRITITREAIERPTEVPIDLFEFRHIANNDTVYWHPMPRKMPDGSSALFFFTDTRVEPDTDYQLQLSGQGYPNVSASIRTPKKVDVIEVDNTNPFVRPFRLNYFLPGLDDYFHMDMTATVRRQGEFDTVDVPIVFTDPSSITWREQGIVVVANLDEGIRQLFNFGHLQVRPDGGTGLFQYTLEKVTLNVTLTHEGWFPRHINWTDSFQQILNYTNTSTGSGFMGGASISRREWVPPPNLQLNFDYDGWKIVVQ